jgi:hypothetical protein
MSAKERFDQMLDAVVDGVNDLAVENDRPADDQFVAATLAILALAISRLPQAVREETLIAIEEGRALRKAVLMYPDRTSTEAPYGTRH